MKQNYFFLTLFFSFLFSYSQIIDIPDANLKSLLVNEDCARIGNSDYFLPVDTNNDGEIDIAEAEAVKELYVYSRDIMVLDGLEYFKNIEDISILDNPISSIDSSIWEQLTELSIYIIELETINLSNNPNLSKLVLYSDKVSELDLSNVQTLDFLSLANNTSLQSLDLSQNTTLKEVYFSKTLNLENLDLSPLLNVERLQIYANFRNDFILPNTSTLKLLDLRYNTLTEVNLNPYPNLEELRLSENSISQIDISSLPALKLFSYSETEVTEPVDTSNNLLLEQLFCNNLKFDALDVSHLTKLRVLSCTENELENLDLSKNVELEDLFINGNKFSSIDLSNNSKLSRIICGNNLFTSLDLSDFPLLYTVDCRDSYLLENLNIKNGASTGFFIYDSTNCPNLSLVCVNNKEYANANFTRKDPSTTFTEDCSLSSSDLNVIGGTVRFNNSNDCASNFESPNIKISYKKEDNEEIVFSNNSGQFSFLSGEGNSSVSILGLPDHFTATPISSDITFEGLGNTEIVDFCLSSTQNINDLAIQIVPTTQTRPGFETTYAITYTNLGSSFSSGIINFNFEDQFQQYVSSTKAPIANNTGLIQFDYVGLAPMDKKTIRVTMVNQPPPILNGGEFLELSVQISTETADDNMDDNLKSFNDLVVNSYDPNDIMVLQGSMITVDQTQYYLDYVIRFQNTGTASAINVAITHVLDPLLNEVTFQPISSSHNYEARIINSKNVEFTFNDINLPPQSEGEQESQGYIAFRIIPQADIQIGDIISANADIYFDFNAPILTNQVMTEVVSTLSNNEVTLHNEWRIFPNPTKDAIRIIGYKSIKTISLYDLNGRILLNEKINNENEKTIDLSNFNAGLFILEVVTQEGKETRQIIKK